MYVTVPIPTRTENDDIEPFNIHVSGQSCSTQPFTLNVVSDKSKWEYVATISMSDADFACLKRVVLEADRQRRESKMNYLEALKVELEAEVTPDEPDDADSVSD